jgi:hypothetical protein
LVGRDLDNAHARKIEVISVGTTLM